MTQLRWALSPTSQLNLHRVGFLMLAVIKDMVSSFIQQSRFLVLCKYLDPYQVNFDPCIFAAAVFCYCGHAETLLGASWLCC